VGGQAPGQAGGHAAGSLVAGYRLEEQVGQGGMAVVYRAWDLRLSRIVAVKVLAPALAADDELRQRFLRESRAAAAVDDPHIIPVFEAGDAEGVLFIAMRYVPGGDVRSLLARTGPLPGRRAALIISAVASALDAAHDGGLMHRDVKPANMLVDVRPGRPDHVYLSDFGLSKGMFSADGLTVAGQVLGTPGYAAPEQISGRLADGRADQYSLACTAFELLAGSPPFPRDLVTAVIWAQLAGPPPRLTSLRPGLPALVDRVLARGLASSPRDRYPSCGQFADALCAALGLAAPDGGTGKAVRVRSRSRALARHRATGRVLRVTAPAWEAATGETTLGSASVASYEANDCHDTRCPARRARGRHDTRLPSSARHRSSILRGGRSAMFLAVVLALASVTYAAVPMLTARQSRAPVALAAFRPFLSSYLGVYEPGSPPGYRPIAEFARAVSRRPNLVASFSSWGQPFDLSFAEILHRHGIVPLVVIDPTHASDAAIAAGEYDSYLRAYAEHVAGFAHPVVIAFGREMNAPWHTWGYGHVPAATFIAAWRHIVNLFRQRGADNVTWLWTIEADGPGTAPIQAWWPGSRYVTWVGIDGFYYRPSDTFASVFGRTINQVRGFTTTPILLSQTAVAPRAGQFAKILDLFRGMTRYRTLGLVWFDINQHNGADRQDWRIENSQQGEYSLRLGAREFMGSASPG
jgi:hypothetical protein